MDPLCSASPGSSTAYENSSGNGDLDNAFKFGFYFGELRASTPGDGAADARRVCVSDGWPTRDS